MEFFRRVEEDRLQDYKQILVWQKAHRLTLAIYQVTKAFPKAEQYGLSNQMRRCSASIGSNIAEGSVQGSDAQFGRFLNIALGSAAELDYQILLAHELEYLDAKLFDKLQSEVDQVKKMLAGFIRKLKA